MSVLGCSITMIRRVTEAEVACLDEGSIGLRNGKSTQCAPFETFLLWLTTPMISVYVTDVAP